MADQPCNATPKAELERQIMDWNTPKNEREWWATKEIEALRRENQELREALTEAQDVLALMDSEGRRAEAFQNVPEDGLIRELCEKIGYGAVMDSAARQWFKKDSVGAITTGTCAGTLRNLKALISRALTMSDIPREQLDRIKPGERKGE